MGQVARKAVKTEKIPLLPTLLTTGNLVCGVIAIILAIYDSFKLILPPPGSSQHVFIPYVTSCYLILLAMVFDVLDGMAARLTNTAGKFGIEYDSLSDVVSFGVAPAILMYVVVLRYQGPVGIALASIFIFAGAFRLARFNVLTNSGAGDPRIFKGLPIPAAASVLVSYVIFSQWFDVYYATGPRLFYDKALDWYSENITTFQHYVIPALMILLAVLMISNVKFSSFKYFLVRERIRFAVLAGSMCALFILFVKFEVSAFLLCTGYVLWNLIKAGYELLKARRQKLKRRKQNG